MSAISINQIKNEALTLSIKDRAVLIRELLESLDTEENDIEEAWITEAERRYANYQQGKAKTRTAADVFARIESLIK